MLIIGSAPLQKVISFAQWFSRNETFSSPALLIKESVAQEAVDALPEWEIIPYRDGPLSLWREPDTMPPGEMLKTAARDGVVFLCSNTRNHHYLNVALLARSLSSHVRAYTTSLDETNVFVPEKALVLLDRGDLQGLKGYVDEYLKFFLDKREGDLKRIAHDPPIYGPRYAALMFTTACNYECVFCPLHGPRFRDRDDDTVYNFRKRLPHDRLLQTADYLALCEELSEMGTEEVALIGWGEPLLRKDCMDIARHIKKLGMKCEFVTNGSLMNQKVRRELLDIGVDHIRISLNAASPDVYAKIHGNVKPEMFHQVVDNIRQLIRERDAGELAAPFVGASFVISKWNLHEIHEMLELSDSIGLQFVTIFPVMATGLDIKIFEDLMIEESDTEVIFDGITRFQNSDNNTNEMIFNISFESFDFLHHPDNYAIERTCYLGWTFVQISPFGDVIPCCGCVSSMGNLHEQTFSDIWSGKIYARMRKRMKAFPEVQKNIEGCDCLRCETVIGKKTELKGDSSWKLSPVSCDSFRYTGK